MQLYAAVIIKEFLTYKSDGSGDVEKNLKDVFKSVLQSDRHADFAEFQQVQETDEVKIAEITETQFYLYSDNIELYIDGVTSMPFYQYNFTTDEFGYYTDMEDILSTWNADEKAPENRFRVYLLHDATLAAPTGSSDFLPLIKLDQFDKTVGGDDNMVTVRLEVRNVAGDLVGNGRYEFYNGGSPTAIILTQGVGEIYIDTSSAQKIAYFRSNHTYRVDNTERVIKIKIFSRIIND